MIAHIGGIPLEEMVPPVLGLGVGPLLVGAWMALRPRRRRDPE